MYKYAQPKYYDSFQNFKRTCLSEMLRFLHCAYKAAQAIIHDKFKHWTADLSKSPK